MMKLRTPSLFASLWVAMFALVLSAGSPVALAVGPLLRDGGHLLDAPTVEKVNGIVKQIRDTYGKDLTIETFASIPESQQAAFSAEKKEVFYEQWLRREARAAETNGVFILILKKPGHVQVGIGAHTTKNFTPADRAQLVDLMLKSFNDGKFDEGVVQGAQFVLDRMEKNGTPHVKEHGADAALPVDVPAATQPAGPATPVVPPTTPSAARSSAVPATSPAKSVEQGPATQPSSKESPAVPASGQDVEPNKK